MLDSDSKIESTPINSQNEIAAGTNYKPVYAEDFLIHRADKECCPESILDKPLVYVK
jgi:hypothetical protein